MVSEVPPRSVPLREPGQRSRLILAPLVCTLLFLPVLLTVDTAAASPFLACHHLAAFAAGGFGGGSTKGAKKSSGKKKKATKAKSLQQKPSSNLFSPEGRMSHISSRIEKAQLTLDVDPNAICMVDNFLGGDFIASLRSEAEALLPTMVPSQSTRWDEISQSVVPYEKHKVLSTQIEGGTTGYAKSPRLVEYVVTLTQSLSARLNPMLPETFQLSGDKQTNKLAVCQGDGSKYDKHIDNGGGDDERKLTALLYLQPPPLSDLRTDDDGGYFRAYDVPDKGNVTSIAPTGDRLLLFWSDSLVHDVSPSYGDSRWALTVWFIVKEGGVIRSTSADIKNRHFGTVSG